MATKTPHAAATMQLCRWLDGATGRGVGGTGIDISRFSSPGAIDHAGPDLHLGHGVEQERERSERKPDCNRASAPPALLLVGEHDPVLDGSFFHDLASVHAAVRLNAAPSPWTSNALKMRTRYRIEKANSCFAVRS